MWIETLLSTRFLAVHRLHHEASGGQTRRTEATETQATRGVHGFGDDNGDEDEVFELDHFDIEVPEPPEYKLRSRVLRDVFEAPQKGDYRTSDCDDLVEKPWIQPTDDRVAEGDAAMTAEADLIRNKIFQDDLQIVVKLANIHLTPKNPTYDGGSWHVEGMLNECIVASALYYYDSENLTDSYLTFREGVNAHELEDYDQDEYDGFLEIYGIADSNAPGVQVLGEVNTRENRLLVFPNVLQHRVCPFGLQDQSKPGHRKLSALFLVDSFMRIPSTANIPPQQLDWLHKAMEERATTMDRLPVELADMVYDAVDDFLIRLEEAKHLREQLMRERRTAEHDVMETHRKEGYCFCEH